MEPFADSRLESFRSFGSSTATPPPNDSQGWTKAVEVIIPYLNTQGIREALRILDHAFRNTQQARSLQKIVFFSNARTSRISKNTATSTLAQVTAEQESLFKELMGLPLAFSSSQDPLLYSDTCRRKERAWNTSSVEPMNLAYDFDHNNIAGLRERALAVKPVVDHSVRYCLATDPRKSQQPLSTSLHALEREDPSCRFMVSWINNDRLMTKERLHQHFGNFGFVVRVLMNDDGGRFAGRGSEGSAFVQMSSQAAVYEVFAHAFEHDVDGCAVCLQI
eukprot:TRINITY_DN5999_c0_g2_i1.p1 TRINITY_DN5999_c0_g2~~TRINITY_DN5999_c0_g2_i1.p1  ORF type:complete len:277 (+),score=32.89 TRINITY_DN5999_c0_g2_i1:47-877(+)